MHGKSTVWTVTAGRGKHRICAEVRIVGPDVLIVVYGGVGPHIGSVAVALPRPSMLQAHAMSSTSSVYNFEGHKDEVIARMFAEKIAAAFNRHTVAAAGVHIDNAGPGDLDVLVKNAELLCDRVVKRLKRSG